MASTFDLLAFELARAVAPLRGVFGSRRGTESLLYVLGWEPPPGGAAGLPVPDLETLLKRLEAAQTALADAQLNVGGGGVELTLNVRLAELASSVVEAIQDLRDLANGTAGWPGAYLAQTNIAAELLPRLVSYLLAEMLREHHPTLFAALMLVGLIEATHFEADPARFQTEHLRYAIRFDRLGALLQAPATVFAARFGWGTPAFRLGDLVGAIALLFGSLGTQVRELVLSAAEEEALLGRPVPEAAANPLPRLDLALLRGLGGNPLDVSLMLAPLRPQAPGGSDGGIALGAFVAGTTAIEFPLDARWNLGIESRLDLQAGIALLLRPNQPLAMRAGLGDVALRAVAPDLMRLAFLYNPAGGRPFALLAVPGGSRLEVQQVAFGLGGRPAGGTAELFVEIELRKARFVLDISGFGGPIASLIPKDIVRADLDLAIGWAAGRVYLRGGAALQASFPVHLSLGPVELQTVVVGLAPGAGSELPIEVSVTVQATLGPLTLLIERIGLTAALDFKGGGAGNVGPFDVDLDFKPPNGIGLSLEAGPISGGGYLSVDTSGKRYAGVLQLKLTMFSLTAFGIYEEVAGETSFVAVLGIRFLPGIQLGFGFAITGVGGLVGLNRRANADLLRERLSSGAAGNVLFCEDPVKNAPTILGDLAALFPANAGTFLVGPTFQIGWLAPIVRIDVGILIELPGPSKIIIIGSLRVVIGFSEEIALLFLRMDVLGIIDFEAQLISIDAALINSHALGVFRLTGGMAFRLAYGSNPYFLLSIGGFHPRFDPGPLNIPKIARVGATLDISLIVSIYLRLEHYVAFTSNTLQIGARVEAGIEIGPISAHGYIQFDGLIQFRPFYFDLAFSAGFSIEVFGISFCSVDVTGQISGPGPIVISARASVKVLFIRVSASATFELGEKDSDRPAPIASPVHELAPELSATANLRTEGDDPSIIARPGRPAVKGVLVSPKGSLIWEQKRAPLNTILHRFGGVPLDAQHELRLDKPPGWQTFDERDWFNPGTFTDFDLQASQTLNNATFQELPSGLRIGSQKDVQAASKIEYEDTINLIKRPEKTRFDNLPAGAYLTGPLHSAVRDRTTTPAVEPGKAKVSVKPETADVHAANGALIHGAETPFQAFQYARQAGGQVAVPSTDVTVAL